MPDEGLAQEELDAMRRRCEAARPGPWASLIEGRDHVSGSSFIMVGEGPARSEDIELTGATDADQDFIASSRRDVVRLLDEVARLRRLLGAIDTRS
ncbi:MAG: hypothetical protein AAF533_04460 [Acidobacteriota bacterium]